MFLLALAGTSGAESSEQAWSCTNEVEVWCAADGCTTAAEGQFTPMSVSMTTAGAFSVCAYTGCWEGDSAPVSRQGRLLWTGDGLPFSTSQDGGMQADVTILLLAAEGVGFVRAAGLAAPVLCRRTSPDIDETAGKPAQ
ncbi:MAG: hypothetical protein VX640_15635 [Pseudomonadota bacterium]|nr:hypothetical protein [Pseudomonadota bacterium]